MRHAAALAMSFMAFFSSVGFADIVFYGSPGGVQPDENVLLADNGIPALSLIGTTNQTNQPVLFTQPVSPELIVSPSSGQSRIAGNDGAFTSLRIQFQDTNWVFTEFEANPIFTGGGITFTVGVVEPNATLSTQNFISGNGQSYFGIEAINGQRIAYVDITGPLNSIEDVRQIRIGGVEDTTPGPTPVPLPASVWGGMALCGLLAIRQVIRNRQSRACV